MFTVLTLLAAVAISACAFYYIIPKLLLSQVGAHLIRRSARRRAHILEKLGAGSSGIIAGFFHPYCDAGGGGERVLWAAIKQVQGEHENVMSVVYTGDQDSSKEDILRRVEDRFSITLNPARIHFIYLTTRNYVAASTWPHFTLLGQSLGSLALAYEAFSLLVPDIYIDTMGYAFTVSLAKLLFRIPTGAYVHYPTISTDMLSSLPASTARARAKLAYWRLFAALYRRCGAHMDAVMANSSWTTAHLHSLWPATTITTVFPPCAVTDILAATPPSCDLDREKILLCIAQFRPEKNHALLLEAFSLFHARTTEHKDARLVLVGSVRHDEDATRVYDLRLQARELGVKDLVVFVTDAPWADVLGWLRRAWVGVNAMWNEHFGIGVVEYQAAGLVGVVHNSGGPKLDIVVPGTGFHAVSADEFADAFEKALSLPAEEVAEMRRAARESAGRFSGEVFEAAWGRQFNALVEML